MEELKKLPKIDIHAHATAFPDFFPPHRVGTRFVSAEEVIDFYDRLGVEKGVLLPISSPEGMITPMTSEACKWLADQYPDRLLWFCNLDPRGMRNDPISDMTSVLGFYKELGAKGVGEITAQIYADDPRLDKLFASCVECDLPALIHIHPQFGGGYGIVDELGLPRLDKMLTKHPELKLLGHSTAFWSEISADNTDAIRNKYPTGKVIPGRIQEMMRNHGNLYCDLSAGSGANALMRDPEHAARFIEEFADRILYGCDICAPHNTHPFPFKDFLEKMLDDGMISPENYRKIVRENAIQLLNI